MFFKRKNRKEKDYQIFFVDGCKQIFEPFLLSHHFVNIKTDVGKSSSVLVYQKDEKYIRILAEDDYWGDGCFFEISIGDKFNLEINDFEEYCISLNRLSKIINNKKEESYRAFPYGKIIANQALIRAKKDFLKYASFYLFEKEDLFNKVLKLKGIRK